MNERYLRKAAFFAAFLLISVGQVNQASAQVAVSPVRIELSNDHSKDVVRVINQVDKTMSYQVEVVAWSQTNERREIYTPTEDIIAVPPLFSIAPGEEQIIRLGMISDADASVERSYRMFITELAPQQEEESRSTGVNMRLQLGIPVFVSPSALPNAALDYFDSRQIENQLFMQMRNSGNTHVKISEIHYLAPGKEEPQAAPAAIYILAGQTGFVPITLPSGKREGTVSLLTDTLGTVEYDLSAPH